MNQQQWLQRLKELHESRYSHHWALGDHVNLGITTWGSDTCFEALRSIAARGSTRNYYRRCAVVAALYPASLRFPTLPFATYEALRHFPVDFLTRFIPEVKDSGRSCKQILHLACEQYGSNPAPHKKRLKRQSVNLKMSVYLAALERAKADGKQVQFLIEQVLTDYLGSETVEAQMDDVGACPSEGNSSDNAQPRPTYAERRAAQKAENEQKHIERHQRKVDKEMRKAEKKLAQICFTTCKGRRTFIDTENGPVKLTVQPPTSFYVLEAALAAARKYSEAKRYVVVPYTCKACSNGKEVFHLRAAAEVDLSVEQDEVRSQVNDFMANTRASLQRASQTSVSG